jgi:hypothetical protein
MTFRAVGPMRRPVDVSRHERAAPRLPWCDAPVADGPPKTLYNRWKRWRDIGVFAWIMMGLSEQAPDQWRTRSCSNSMEADFCVEALKETIAKYGKPAIMNSPSRDHATHNPVWRWIRAVSSLALNG